MNKKKISVLVTAAMITSMVSTMIPSSNDIVLLNNNNNQPKKKERLVAKSNKKIVYKSEKIISKSNEKMAHVSKPMGLASETMGLVNQTINLNGVDGMNPKFTSISFDTSNNSLNVQEQVNSWNMIYDNATVNLYKITLYSANGKIIKSKTYNNDMNSNDPNSYANIGGDFSSLQYQYGDTLSIKSYNGSNLSVNNFDGESTYNNSSTINFLITPQGLKNLNKNLKINSAYTGPNFNELNISGSTAPNQEVNIYLNNKEYETKSNDKGIFKAIINSNEKLDSNTEIEIFVKDYGLSSRKVEINPEINQFKNQIEIYHTLQGNQSEMGTLKFNPYNNTITVNGNSAIQINGAAEEMGQGLMISIYNSEGKLIINKSYSYYDSWSSIINDFNGFKYKNGETVKITGYNNGLGDSASVGITNYNKQSLYINQTQEFTISNDKLVPTNMQEINVNPFDILIPKSSVYSGDLTGVTATPNEAVEAEVNGQIFKGVSNNKGIFNINIKDKAGFTSKTAISVMGKNQLGVIVNPVVTNNLTLKNYTIENSYNPDTPYPEALTFNVLNNTIGLRLDRNNISGDGYNFGFQLIGGKTGIVKANVTAPGSNVFPKSNVSLGNNYNYSYNYGDIIALYQNQQNLDTIGPLYYVTGKNKNIKVISRINCTKDIYMYRITPEGLVPIQDKDLETSELLNSNTNSTMELTGKTIPNHKVTISYGSTNKVITSNGKGEFSFSIPCKDAPVGTSVRVFVNNENAKAIIVKYSKNVENQFNDKIKISNNYGIQAATIGLNPINQVFSVNINNDSTSMPSAFYSNGLRISVINPTSGEVMYQYNNVSIDGLKNLSKTFNDKHYAENDIIKISYNPNLVGVGVYDGNNNNNKGNTTGQVEYFKITSQGFKKVSPKFINVSNLDFLNGSKIDNINLKGKVEPNSKVEISVDGKSFSGLSNGEGTFDIAISDVKGFNENTKISLNSADYMPTIVTPTVSSKISLSNNYINFYSSGVPSNGGTSNLQSSIGFNPAIMEMTVSNDIKSFGDGASNYFTLGLYKPDGSNIFKDSFNNGPTSEVYSKINGQKFNYGDIISLKYNNNISTVTVLDGSNIVNNISGNVQYFEITKSGLKAVDFGNVATVESGKWNSGTLKLNIGLAIGNTLSNEGNLKVDILSQGKVLKSLPIEKGNDGNIYVELSSNLLSNLLSNKIYTFAVNLNGELYNLKSTGDFSNYENYILSENNEGEFILNKYTLRNNINNINDISKLKTNLNSTLLNNLKSNINMKSIINDNNLNYDVTTNEFINKVGEGNLNKIFNESNANKNFINWLLNNKTAMEEYLNGLSPQTAININSLEIWSKIWNGYSNSRYGFNLKLAIAVSISNATPIIAWPTLTYYDLRNDTTTVGNPVERYSIFEQLNSSNSMYPMFKTLDVRHLEYTVNTPIANNQIIELRNILLQGFNGYVSNPGELNQVGFNVNYTSINRTGGRIFQNIDFYGKDPNVAQVFYQGGVCVSISHISAAACQVFGIPAMVLNQPGHAPYLYYTKNKQWEIGYNLSGLSNTTGGDVSGWSNGLNENLSDLVTSYDYVYQAADDGNLKKSNQYLWASEVSNLPYKEKLAFINKAIAVEPLNVIAWEDKINLLESNNSATGEDYINLANGIIENLKDYPLPMIDLLGKIKEKLAINTTYEQFNNIVESLNNTLNYDINNGVQTSVGKLILKNIYQYGFVKESNSLSLNTISLSTNGLDIGSIGFNTASMIFAIKESNEYIGIANFNLSIKVFNPKTGKVVLKADTSSDQDNQELYSIMNGKSFEYGDVITISTSNESANVINNKGKVIATTSTNGKPKSFEITPDGLVPYITITGTSNKTILVNTEFNPLKGVVLHDVLDPKAKIEIKGKVDTKKAGVYKLTYIVKNANGDEYDTTRIISVVLPLGIENIGFSYFGGNEKVGTLGFDTVNKKFMVTNTDPNEPWSWPGMTATIKVYNPLTGRVSINSVLNDDATGSQLESSMNGKSFNYGDIISINTSEELVNVSNAKGENIGASPNYYGGQINESFEITPNGLIPYIPRAIKPEIKLTPISISGLSNETVEYDSNFNPLKGVVLHDEAEPNAKINVEGTIDTKKPGIYKLTYTVNNNNGQKFESVRMITVKEKAIQPKKNINKKGNIESAYWSQTKDGRQFMAISGDVASKEPISWKTPRHLVLLNAEGKIVENFNTCYRGNWYSKNKDNYSAFQGILFNSELNEIKPGITYTLGVDMGGKVTPLTGNISSCSNGIYNFGINNENQLTITRNGVELNVTGATVKNAYWSETSNGERFMSISGIMDMSSGEMSENLNKSLLILNSEGQVIDRASAVYNANWYENNKENYSSFQGILFNEKDFSNLVSGEKYKVAMEVNGKTYDLKGNVNLNYNGYTLSGTNNGQVTLSKNEEGVFSNATLMESYWSQTNDGKEFIAFSGKINSRKAISPNTARQAVIVDSKGKVVEKLTTYRANWWGNNENDYDAFQGILFKGENLSSLKVGETYKLEVEINGKLIPIIGEKDKLISGKGYSMGLTSNNELTISKE